MTSVRQSSTPVAHQRANRLDTTVLMSSGRAGSVIPVAQIPVNRQESASGSLAIDIDLAEMPRPLLNGVMAKLQVWFVSKAAHPQFAGPDEFAHSYEGQSIKTLGAPDRVPPPFYTTISGNDLVTVDGSDFFRTLGLHIVPGTAINSDLIDAFNLIYNFRLAAHSSRLDRKQYTSEDLSEALALPPAFWPTGQFSRVVPDYERALIVGNLDLQVSSGRLPVTGIGISASGDGVNNVAVRDSAGEEVRYTGARQVGSGDIADMWIEMIAGFPNVAAEFAGQEIGITLADIDKARTTQAFAKLRTAYAGNDSTGFDNDDVIVAQLMRGFVVDDDSWKRPMLVGQSDTMFGMAERHATDGANLDESVTKGRASLTTSINLPETPHGGYLIATLEVVPQRIFERASDEYLHISDRAELPDALRDIQRTEPVDMVLSRRVDARHSTPDELYGYEPMNEVFNRDFTRLGGLFYQDDPEATVSTQRFAIWMDNVIDPEFSRDHFLVPDDFPHDVFSDTVAPAFEFVARHSVTINTLTLFGDVLAEDNNDYDNVDLEPEV